MKRWEHRGNKLFTKNLHNKNDVNNVNDFGKCPKKF